MSSFDLSSVSTELASVRQDVAALLVVTTRGSSVAVATKAQTVAAVAMP